VTEAARGPLRVRAEVLTSKRSGSYHHLSLIAPGVGERFRPGTLLGLGVGAGVGHGDRDRSDRLLRRAVPIARVRTSATYPSTVDLVLEAHEPGLRWLCDQPAGAPLDALGPLGRPYALPKDPVTCTLVGCGHHAAPLFSLAERLKERGCTVHVVLAAAAEPELFGVLEARRAARSVVVATEDGSVGLHGTLAELLPGLLARTPSDVVYAAGPVAPLHAVAAAAEEHGAWSQTALPPTLVCATGACLGCAVPVVGEDGVARQARGCVDGPVFRGDRVRWASLKGAAWSST
jgi:dihydroorotate dehydrogenase electron transfer subunit